MKTDEESNPPGGSRLSATLWAVRLIWQAHPQIVIGLAVCTLVRGSAPAGFAIAIRGLINAVTAATGDTGTTNDEAITWLIVAFVITIADSLTGLAVRLFTDRLKSNLTLTVNSMVMRHASTLDTPYIENAHNRELLERVQQDPGSKLHLLFFNSQRALLAGFQVVSLAAVLAWLEPFVILFAMLLSIPFFIFQWRLSRRRYMTEFKRSDKRRWTSYFLTRLTNPLYAGEVKLLGIGGLLTERFVATMEEFRDQDQALQLRQFTGGALFVTVTTIAFYALFSRVIFRAVEGSLSVGDLAIFGGAVVRLRTALETGIQFTAKAYEQTLYVADLRTFLHSLPVLPDKGTYNPPPDKQAALVMEDVSFTYPGSELAVLHDISLEIAPGETVAIVGENGSGKSTLAKLLARLYDVSAGSIKLNGVPLGDYPLHLLHREVALLGQNFGRYEASLAENLAYGDWERLAEDRQAISQLAAETGVNHIATRLPQGLDTPLGREFSEHDLSGGQWQLLAIARTLARQASVLILDEPTSSIDARAEHALYDAINRVAKDVTTIIISHRFSTISMADRILVIADGTIVEQGTHQALLDAKGTYAKLFSLHEHYRMKDMGII